MSYNLIFKDNNLIPYEWKLLIKDLLPTDSALSVDIILKKIKKNYLKCVAYSLEKSHPESNTLYSELIKFENLDKEIFLFNCQENKNQLPNEFKNIIKNHFDKIHKKNIFREEFILLEQDFFDKKLFIPDKIFNEEVFNFKANQSKKILNFLAKYSGIDLKEDYLKNYIYTVDGKNIIAQHHSGFTKKFTNYQSEVLYKQLKNRPDVLKKGLNSIIKHRLIDLTLPEFFELLKLQHEIYSLIQKSPYKSSLKGFNFLSSSSSKAAHDFIIGIELDRNIK